MKPRALCAWQWCWLFPLLSWTYELSPGDFHFLKKKKKRFSSKKISKKHISCLFSTHMVAGDKDCSSSREWQTKKGRDSLPVTKDSPGHICICLVNSLLKRKGKLKSVKGAEMPKSWHASGRQLGVQNNQTGTYKRKILFNLRKWGAYLLRCLPSYPFGFSLSHMNMSWHSACCRMIFVFQRNLESISSWEHKTKVDKMCGISSAKFVPRENLSVL